MSTKPQTLNPDHGHHDEPHYDLIVEEKFKFFRMRGKCQVCEVEEHPHVDTPTDVISTGQTWSVKLWWETTGALNCLMAGDWKCQVYLEKFGQGEYDPPNSAVTEPFHSAPHSYHTEIVFPPGSMQAGVYKGVATIQMCGPNGDLGPIVGYCELGWLHFYDTKPFKGSDDQFLSDITPDGGNGQENAGASDKGN